VLIPSGFWVSAFLHRVAQGGGFAYVTHKGDERAGAIMLKFIDCLSREVFLLRAVNNGDEMMWIRPKDSGNEGDLDPYIEKQCRFDADLWVIEVETREGKTFLTEKIEQK
jgi:hypothetical protein